MRGRGVLVCVFALLLLVCLFVCLFVCGEWSGEEWSGRGEGVEGRGEKHARGCVCWWVNDLVGLKRTRPSSHLICSSPHTSHTTRHSTHQSQKPEQKKKSKKNRTTMSLHYPTPSLLHHLRSQPDFPRLVQSQHALFRYLNNTPAAGLDERQMVQVTKRLRKMEKAQLSKAEILQIVNLVPRKEWEVNLVKW